MKCGFCVFFWVFFWLLQKIVLDRDHLLWYSNVLSSMKGEISGEKTHWMSKKRMNPFDHTCQATVLSLLGNTFVSHPAACL